MRVSFSSKPRRRLRLSYQRSAREQTRLLERSLQGVLRESFKSRTSAKIRVEAARVRVFIDVGGVNRTIVESRLNSTLINLQKKLEFITRKHVIVDIADNKPGNFARKARSRGIAIPGYVAGSPHHTSLDTSLAPAVLETSVPVGKRPTPAPRSRLQRARLLQKTISRSPHLIKSPSFEPKAAGQSVVEELKAAEGGAWTSRDLRMKLGVSKRELVVRRSEFRIMFWQDTDDQYHYPKWQFTESGELLAGVREVLGVFQSLDVWRIMLYFLERRVETG